MDVFPKLVFPFWKTILEIMAFSQFWKNNFGNKDVFPKLEQLGNTDVLFQIWKQQFWKHKRFIPNLETPISGNTDVFQIWKKQFWK